VGHRCSSYPLIKAICPDAIELSLFSGCFGDLYSHLKLFYSVTTGVIPNDHLGLISGRYKYNRRILSKDDGSAVSIDVALQVD